MSAQVRPDGVSRRLALDYLAREADLDGVVTVGTPELGRVLGMTQYAAWLHVQSLLAEGLLVDTGETMGKNVKAYRVGEAPA
jgi:hypothetical protein